MPLLPLAQRQSSAPNLRFCLRSYLGNILGRTTRLKFRLGLGSLGPFLATVQYSLSIYALLFEFARHT